MIISQIGGLMSLLKRIIDNYMEKVSELREHCNKCLDTRRWGGSVVLMVVDAAFTSIGLNYFTAVVPKVEEFSRKFVESGKIKNLKDLAKADLEEKYEMPHVIRNLVRNAEKNGKWSPDYAIKKYLEDIGESESDKILEFSN